MCPIMKTESWTVCPKKDASGDGKLGIKFVWPNAVCAGGCTGVCMCRSALLDVLCARALVYCV